MSRNFLLRSVLCTALAVLLPICSHAERVHSQEFHRAEQKFRWIAENGERGEPSTRPTVVTAEEWNAYLKEGGVQLPDAVSAIQITTDPGIAYAKADVDFDRLTSNGTRNNPLLFLFTGKHHVAAVARVHGSSGMATVHIQSVAFDGVEIPRIALEFFASRFLRPKYGKAIALDSTFELPDHIDSAVVGVDQVTITQR